MRAGNGGSHLKYVIYEYNKLCPYPVTAASQRVGGEPVTLAEACRRLGLETIVSMPFAMGNTLKQYSARELLEFALAGADHVIVGSKSKEHIRELLAYVNEKQI